MFKRFRQDWKQNSRAERISFVAVIGALCLTASYIIPDAIRPTKSRNQEPDMAHVFDAHQVNQSNWGNLQENQEMRVTYGINSSSYEILTDLDSDGCWDVLERKACGYDGNANYGCSHNFYVKSGFNFSEEIARKKPNSETKIKTVEPEFFEPYQ